MGRFILLTYNLSALYAYSLSVKDAQDDDDDEVSFFYRGKMIKSRSFPRVAAILIS